MSLPDDTSPFGRYRPAAGLRVLTFLAQLCPANTVPGRRLAEAMGDHVLRRATLPMDATVNGLRLRCYGHDNRSERKFLFTPRRFDPRERALLARELPPDGVFVDLGANVGLYTLCACQTLGPAGTVVACEPHPEVFRRLAFHVNINARTDGSWPCVVTLPIGVSDRAGEFPLHLNPRNLGGSSLRAARHDAGGTIQVPCQPLRAILADAGVRRIDVLKIDVEGAEDLALVPFLAEAEAAILPRWLIVEASQSQWQADLPGALRQRDYQVAARTKMNVIYRR